MRAWLVRVVEDLCACLKGRVASPMRSYPL